MVECQGDSVCVYGPAASIWESLRREVIDSSPRGLQMETPFRDGEQYGYKLYIRKIHCIVSIYKSLLYCLYIIYYFDPL